MERLLCVKIASRGDLLLCGPAFRKLREERSEARVELVVGESCADVAMHLPFFQAIHRVNDFQLLAGTLSEKLFAAKEFLKLLKGTVPAPFSEIFIFHRDWRYGALAWWSGISLRRGFEVSGGARFLTNAYPPGAREHHVSQYLGMVGYPGEPEPLKGVWKFLEGEKEEGCAAAARWGYRSSGRPSVVLGFGGGRNVKTRTQLKTWPLDSYKDLARRLVQAGCQVIWVGDGEDAALLKGEICGVLLAGKLTVVQTAAVIAGAQWVVSNDTLMLHLAEALAIPSLGIFGPTDPMHYRPLGQYSSYLWAGKAVPCSPCHQDGYFPPCLHQHECMAELTVDQVWGQGLKVPELNLKCAA